MRIVIVMVEAPVPFGKAVARWYAVLLRALVARGHRVTAFAACSDLGQMAEAARLFPAPTYDLRLYAFSQRRGPLAKLETLRRPHSYPFGDALKLDLARELAAGFDVLHLEELWAGWLGQRYADKALVNVFCLARIDQELTRPGSLRGRLTRRLTLAAERRLLRDFKHFRVNTPRVAAEICRVNPHAHVATNPFGLDTSLYPYAPDAARPASPVVALIGSMGWSPSHSAALRLLTRLWPEVKRRVPAARLHVAGWSARVALRDFLHLPGVTIDADVPDARPHFENAAVLLYAPERGSGVKVKVLEALAYGTPVVTTSEGNEGLGGTDGVELGVADDDAGLVARTVALLSDPAAQNRQREAGRRLVERVCDPAAALDALEATYARMRAGRGVIVGVNAMSLTTPRVRGWTRYAVNLLRELLKLGVGLRLYARTPLDPAHLGELGPGDCEVRVAPPMRYILWEQVWLPRQCRRDGVALLHSPHNFGLPVCCPVPRVLTLHDAIDTVYSHDRLPWGAWLRPGHARARLMLQVARRSADRIVTVSGHAKADLVRRFGLPAERIDVIPEAADACFHRPPTAAEAARVAETHGLRRPYFVYVGGAEARKNVGFLARAFAAADLPGVELVLAGGGDFGASVGPGVRAVGYVAEADLPALYAGALGFAYPSEYEGFGLQLVEAMAAGCPTLAADATSLPEVLGRGGDLFPLGDPATLTALLRRLATDPAYRADLAARGRRRAVEFSWGRAARATLATYEATLRR